MISLARRFPSQAAQHGNGGGVKLGLRIQMQFLEIV
jgi:hypothetical protein